MILTSDECKMRCICNMSIFSQCMWRLVLVLCYTLRLFTTYLMNLFLIFLLLLSNYSKVYLWRQSTSGRSASVNQELQGMSSKFQLYKLFLILNVCVVFQSDNEKLVHFFRLPSCKCDICCLEKVNLESVKAANTKPRRECDPCRIVKKWAKWLGGVFYLLISWALEQGSSILRQLLISAKLLKSEAICLILLELL